MGDQLKQMLDAVARHLEGHGGDLVFIDIRVFEDPEGAGDAPPDEWALTQEDYGANKLTVGKMKKGNR